MSRISTCDFSNGDLKQWRLAHSSGPDARAKGDYSWKPKDIYPKGRSDGSVAIKSDPDCGYYAQLKLLPEDSAQTGGWAGTQKAQLDDSDNHVQENDTLWVAWSQKFVQFDAWPAARKTRNFLITNEWHGIYGPSPGGGSVFWGMPNWNGPTTNKTEESFPGYWSLFVDQYTEYNNPNTVFDRKILLHVPINIGNWIDVKMQIKWATAANGGFIRCWINNEPQTLLTGGDTWFGQVTAPFAPGDEYQYYAAALYRSGSAQVDANYPLPWETMIFNVANHRSATAESSL
jgi:hypothetical protein